MRQGRFCLHDSCTHDKHQFGGGLSAEEGRLWPADYHTAHTQPELHSTVRLQSALFHHDHAGLPIVSVLFRIVLWDTTSPTDP